MRRILTVLGIALVVSGTTAGLAGASGGPAKLELRKTSAGTILVNGRGFTLYAFTRDGKNRDACTKIKNCLGAWPAVTTSGKPIAGKGVHAGLIGTITLGRGVKQVTYAGHPLYTYIGDSGPGQTFYINFLQFGGRWPALDASGKEVK